MKLDVIEWISEVDGNVNNGVKIVASNKKWGAIDNENNEVIPIIFDSIKRLSSKYFQVIQDAKIGMYDYSGKKILEPIYTSLDCDFTHKIIIVCDELSNYFACDMEGNRIFVNNYEYISSDVCKCGIYIAKKDGKYGVICKNETNIIAFEYNNIIYNRDIYAFMAYANGKCDIMDKKGNVILSGNFKYFRKHFDSFSVQAQGENGKKFLLYSDDFELIKSIEDANIRCFGMSLVSYHKDEKTVIYNIKTKTEFELDYRVSEVFEICEDIYYVEGLVDDMCGLVNSKGETILSRMYDDISFCNNPIQNRMRIRQGSLFGVYSLNGEIVIDIKYDAIETVRADGENYFAVKKGNLWGLFDMSGNVLLDTIYDAPPRVSEGYSKRYAVVSYQGFPGKVYF